LSAISRSSGWDGSLPASSITVSPGLQGWGALGCAGVHTPHPNNHLQRRCSQGSPLKVLGTWGRRALLTSAPLARQVPDTTRATGRKSRLPSSFDAKSRNILPANRIAPFWPPPPLRETVFLSPAKRAAPATSPTPRRSHRRQRMQRPWVDSRRQIAQQCLAKSGHRDAGHKGRAHRRRASGRLPLDKGHSVTAGLTDSWPMLIS
jgi:hypothetical protein